MVNFKVGDRVVRNTLRPGEVVSRFGSTLVGGSVYTVSAVPGGELFPFYLALAEAPEAGAQWLAANFGLYKEPMVGVAVPEELFTVRSNDPVTSKGKRKINKYEETVLAQLSLIGPSTGKEIASLSNQPLNCITPRFAPLRRKGLIKDSGSKRDKQIVWVLA